MYYIYRITNLIDGKTYIGQHKYKYINDSYMGSGILLNKAIKKYGKENFKKEILYSRIQYKETANDMEKFAIKKEKDLVKAEYNIANGGEGGYLGQTLGKHRSEETKKKLSKSLKKYYSSLENKIGNQKGKHWYNNGEKETLASNQPKGFSLGRLRK